MISHQRMRLACRGRK